MRSVLAAAAAFASLSAAAQAPTQPAQPAERAAAERPALNLRLDDALSRPVVTFGPEKEPATVLPALGDDARRIEPPSRPRPGSASSPFPKDTQRNE